MNLPLLHSAELILHRRWCQLLQYVVNCIKGWKVCTNATTDPCQLRASLRVRTQVILAMDPFRCQQRDVPVPGSSESWRVCVECGTFVYLILPSLCLVLYPDKNEELMDSVIVIAVTAVVSMPPVDRQCPPTSPTTVCASRTCSFFIK